MRTLLIIALVGISLLPVTAWPQGGDASRIGDRVNAVAIPGKPQRNPTVGDATSTTEILQPLRVSGTSGCLNDILTQATALQDLVRQSMGAPKIPGRVWPVEQAAYNKSGEVIRLTQECIGKAEALRELIKGAIR